jgi:5-methylcytosine-specific restriction endonuclease McrA
VCRIYQNSSWIVFKIGNRRYEALYDNPNYLWNICNSCNSFDTYQIFDHKIELAFFIRLGIFKIYDYAFDKQKAIFCNDNVEKFWLLSENTQDVVVDLTFDKIVGISDNSDLIQIKIR